MSVRILVIKTSFGRIRLYYASEYKILRVLVMEGTSKIMVTLRSLRHNHQQDIMKSTGVQRNYICVFFVFAHTCMRVYFARKCAYPVHEYFVNIVAIYTVLEQFAKFYSTASWFLNDKYLLGGWQLQCQVSIQIAHCNIWVKEPWKMKYMLESKEEKSQLLQFCQVST